jgi:hypothetical protein
MKQQGFASATALALALALVLPAGAQTKDTNPPRLDVDLAALFPVPKEFPLLLLFYKHVPNAFSYEYMLQQTQFQMRKDQYYYKLQETTGGRMNPPPNYVFVFSSAQVKGRVAEFAAKELLPTYRKYWSDAASKIPDRLSFSMEEGLGGLEYADGRIKSKSQTYLVSYSSFGSYKLTSEEKLRLPPLGTREVLARAPTLKGVIPIKHFADTVASSAPSQRVYFAPDRDPVIPPLAMDPKAAEDLWRGPQCAVDELTYRQKGAPPKQAHDAAEQCRRERARYSSPRVAANFDIEIEGVDFVRNEWIIKARVLGAKLFGPTGNLLKTYAASEFPRGQDVWEARAEKESAERREKEGKKAREEAEKQARATKLSNADIVGIRLGMTVAEAERKIRGRMTVGWVATLLDLEDRKRNPQWRAPYLPYSEFRMFISADGNEYIALYSQKDISDRVLGVLRRVPVHAGTSKVEVFRSLLNKYGQEPMNEYGQKPAINEGSESEVVWTEVLRRQECKIDLVRHDIDLLHNMRVLEGDEAHFRKLNYPPSIYVYGGTRGEPSWEGRTWDAEKWRLCGPTVLARMPPNNQGMTLTVGVFNLAAYRDIYKRRTIKTKPPGKPPDL